MRRRPQRGRGDRGVALVEFALIMPLLFLLMIGTITGGMTLSRDNSVKNAVREGTRFGAVNPVGSPPAPFTYLGEVLDATKSAAAGDLDDGTAGKQLCAAFLSEGKSWRVRENTSGTRTTSSDLSGLTAVCFTDGRPATEERLQVTASRTSEIQGIFFTLTPTLSSQSVTRYER